MRVLVGDGSLGEVVLQRTPADRTLPDRLRPAPDHVADEEAILVGASAMAAVFLEPFERGLP